MDAPNRGGPPWSMRSRRRSSAELEVEAALRADPVVTFDLLYIERLAAAVALLEKALPEGGGSAWVAQRRGASCLYGTNAIRRRILATPGAGPPGGVPERDEGSAAGRGGARRGPARRGSEEGPRVPRRSREGPDRHHPRPLSPAPHHPTPHPASSTSCVGKTTRCPVASLRLMTSQQPAVARIEVRRGLVEEEHPGSAARTLAREHSLPLPTAEFLHLAVWGRGASTSSSAARASSNALRVASRAARATASGGGGRPERRSRGKTVRTSGGDGRGAGRGPARVRLRSGTPLEEDFPRRRGPRPASTLRSVDFPEPFSPRRARNGLAGVQVDAVEDVAAPVAGGDARGRGASGVASGAGRGRPAHRGAPSRRRLRAHPMRRGSARGYRPRRGGRRRRGRSRGGAAGARDEAPDGVWDEQADEADDPRVRYRRGRKERRRDVGAA